MVFDETFMPPAVDEIDRRVSRLRSAMEHEGLSGYVSVAPSNILWLTNFANYVHERPFILIVPITGQSTFLVPRLELDHVTRRAIGAIEFVTYPEFPAPEGKRWNDRLPALIPTGGKIGVETMAPGALTRIVGNRAEPVDLVERLREIKSDYELGRIAYSCRLLSEAHADLMAMARPGMSQNDIDGTIRKSIHARMIADNPSVNPFATSVMTMIQNRGASHDPHNFTDLNMRMECGGPNLTVFNAVLNGYGAEIERTFFLESVPDEARAPFETMMEARRIAFEMTHAGTIMGDIDRTLNKLFDDRGYGDARRHRAGHGMGVTSHEGPFLADGDEGEIRPGMVFTIEPGIYLPGLGGFRHSDTVAVTETGLVTLTDGPEQLDELIL